MKSEMSTDERERFTKHVTALFRARWDTVKIADWAISASSGFGRFWQSHAHALSEINQIARAVNAQTRSLNRQIAAAQRRSHLLSKDGKTLYRIEL